VVKNSIKAFNYSLKTDVVVLTHSFYWKYNSPRLKKARGCYTTRIFLNARDEENFESDS
jgi:hypothetical protein